LLTIFLLYPTIFFRCDVGDENHVDDVYGADDVLRVHVYDEHDVPLSSFFFFSPVTTALLYRQRG
jgi:hypothetical protein